MPEQVMESLEGAEEVLPDPDPCEYCCSSFHVTADHGCAVCSRHHAEVDYHSWCGECESWECESDHDEDDYDEDYPEDGENIHDYSWQPSTLIYRSMEDDEPVEHTQVSRGHGAHSYPAPPTNAPYLGLEVELECVHGRPRDVARAWNDSYIGWSKTDGSLSNQGIECVTHPITYERLERDDYLANVLTALKQAGGRAWMPGHCGLHIHISRPSFTGKAHQWRFAAAHEAMSPELRQLSGRAGEEGYCKWSGAMTYTIPERSFAPPPLPPCPEELGCSELWPSDREAWHREHRAHRRSQRDPLLVEQKAYRVIAGKQTQSDRYVSVNVTDGTIELRFWRGSLAPDHVLGAAALADGIQQWTRDMTFAEVRRSLTRPGPSVVGVLATTASHPSDAWSAFQAWAIHNLPITQVTRIKKLCDRRSLPCHTDLVAAVEAATEEVKA